MSVEHLIRMANDIADYFRSEPDHALAVAGVSNHMKKFWDPRMRRQIAAHVREQEGDGLSELARAAVVQLAALDAAKAQSSQRG